MRYLLVITSSRHQPWQVAAGISLGLLVGTWIHSPLLLIVGLAVLYVLPVHLLAAIVAVIGGALCCWYGASSWVNQAGQWILMQPAVTGWLAHLYQMPFVPWLRLHSTSAAGGLAIGLVQAPFSFLFAWIVLRQILRTDEPSQVYHGVATDPVWEAGDLPDFAAFESTVGWDAVEEQDALAEHAAVSDVRNVHEPDGLSEPNRLPSHHGAVSDVAVLNEQSSLPEIPRDDRAPRQLNVAELPTPAPIPETPDVPATAERVSSFLETCTVEDVDRLTTGAIAERAAELAVLVDQLISDLNAPVGQSNPPHNEADDGSRASDSRRVEQVDHTSKLDHAAGLSPESWQLTDTIDLTRRDESSAEDPTSARQNQEVAGRAGDLADRNVEDSSKNARATVTGDAPSTCVCTDEVGRSLSASKATRSGEMPNYLSMNPADNPQTQPLNSPPLGPDAGQNQPLTNGPNETADTSQLVQADAGWAGDQEPGDTGKDRIVTRMDPLAAPESGRSGADSGGVTANRVGRSHLQTRCADNVETNRVGRSVSVAATTEQHANRSTLPYSADADQTLRYLLAFLKELEARQQEEQSR